ncbi:fas-binding factor 1 [Hyperolius riggenbachi]|uniref:fas-binding factor 1 n=1 Tax=Hyperolius riggenbachi TaxID=752182 RepID=UPI0035A39B0E
MASKNKKGLKDSIDDVLGDLLGDDDPATPKQQKTIPRTSASAYKSKITLSSGKNKKSALTDDFFRELAKESAQESDVSDADPQALLESLKDLDDMDAEIFGTKKPRSAPVKESRMQQSSGKNQKPEEKITGTSAPGSEKKPQSAPAAPARPYKKFSFDDLDDPLDDLLSDEGPGTSKKLQSAKSEPEPVKTGGTSVASLTRNPGRPSPASRRKDDLDFEEDADDIMDALGIDDGLEGSQKGQRSAIRPARSKLDELMGRGTSAKLLERPPTGDKKEFKLDPKYQKMPEKMDLLGDDDFAFGSYQPTIAMSPEGRPSRRSSVRFSGDGNENLKTDARSVTTTPVVQSPAHSAKSGADWLGLKDEDIPDWSPSLPLKEPPRASAVTPTSAGVPTSGTKTDNKTTTQSRASPTISQPKANQTSSQPNITDTFPQTAPQPKDTPTHSAAAPKEDDEWLLSAIARKKIQKQDKVVEQMGQTPNGTEHGAVPAMVNTTPHSGLGSIASKAIPEAEMSWSPLPWESPRKESTFISPAVPRHKGNTETVPTTGTSDSRRDHIQQPLPALSKAFHNDKDSSGELLQSQKILDLEAQIRKIHLEKEQQNLLLATLQQRHQEDLELIDNAQRNRLKLMEDSASQREERLRKENQDLSSQYLSLCQKAESEKAELLAQYQRKLTEFQQEKDKEIERVKELQRLSVQGMCKDHEDQLQRLKRLKEQEIDAVTSASSQTRSLNGIIEQMEAFSYKLSDLSVRVESTQMNTSQEIEIGARQREGQLRALQERLTQQQKDMEEEQKNLRMIITNLDTRLSEQSRLLEQERWRVSAEQAKVESLQRSLEEQKRIMKQQMAKEREELERAKSALLEEQQSVMTYCAEERRKIAAEWEELRSQKKLSKERVESDLTRAKIAESHREGALISLAKEQAELKVQATELRNKEEQLSVIREALEKEKHELRLEKDRVYATAMRVRQRADEVESMSKLALQRHEDGEKALGEAKKVESGHQDRLAGIQQQLERLRQQEEHLLQERKNLAHHRRQFSQLCQGVPIAAAQLSNTPHETPAPALSLHANGVPFAVPSTKLHQSIAAETSHMYASLARFKLSAQQDRDFLEDEQLFLEALKKLNMSHSQTV